MIRSASRLLCRSLGVGSRAARSFSSDAASFDDMVQHMELLKAKFSFNPVPYDSSIPMIPVSANDVQGSTHKKVSVIGCGQVGMAIAYALLNQTIPSTMAMVDMNKEKLEGEAKDLEQGSAFHQNVRVMCDSDYGVTEGSHLVMITAGAAQKAGESRLNLIEKNVKIMKSIIPVVLEHSPDAAICIVSNPCDIMTAVANKIAGPGIPPGRIFGSGTCLDSSRLQSLLAKTLNIDAQSVEGYVVGEHGDSSVPVWSSVRVGGVPLLEPGAKPSPILDAMHREVVDSAYDVILKKGYTNWAIGLTNAYIANAVVDDTHSLMPLSTCVRGVHGIEEDVWLSMPCSVGSHGVRRVIDLPMTDHEIECFRNSAKTVWGVQEGVWDSV